MLFRITSILVMSMFIGAAASATDSPTDPAIAKQCLRKETSVIDLGDRAMVVGPGWHATATATDIAWCVTTGKEPVCGVAETRYGCQYWPEEGGDDLAVCILTVADEACNGCISGEPWR